MRKILNSEFQNLQFFDDYFCLFTFFSEDTGKFSWAHKNMSRHYPKLFPPVHGIDKTLIFLKILVVVKKHDNYKFSSKINIYCFSYNI